MRLKKAGFGQRFRPCLSVDIVDPVVEGFERTLDIAV
jgi:hypothetical protein